MSFLDALNGGLEKAAETSRKCNEVDSVFHVMNEELKSFATASVQVKRASTSLSVISAWVESKENGKSSDAYFTEDVLNLHVKLEGGSSFVAKVAGWRQSINGWPCTVSFEGQEVVCFKKIELENTLQELLGSTSFGRVLSEQLNRKSKPF